MERKEAGYSLGSAYTGTNYGRKVAPGRTTKLWSRVADADVSLCRSSQQRSFKFIPVGVCKPLSITNHAAKVEF